MLVFSDMGSLAFCWSDVKFYYIYIMHIFPYESGSKVELRSNYSSPLRLLLGLVLFVTVGLFLWNGSTLVFVPARVPKFPRAWEATLNSLHIYPPGRVNGGNSALIYHILTHFTVFTGHLKTAHLNSSEPFRTPKRGCRNSIAMHNVSVLLCVPLYNLNISSLRREFAPPKRIRCDWPNAASFREAGARPGRG